METLFTVTELWLMQSGQLQMKENQTNGDGRHHLLAVSYWSHLSGNTTRKGQLMFRELKYKIADRLFERELDEAFFLGIREGQSRQASKLRVQMEYKKTRSRETGMTKTQAIGYDRCMEVVKDAIK
jgi:hypothetical protein